MRKQALDEIIESKCLLKHPFYQAWNMGTLTKGDLAVYATQYGEFIDTIATGWEAVGDSDTAQEERAHALLWTDFATDLNAPRPAGSRLPEITELVELAHASFSNRPQALGALYAFEHQQPATAHSKLEGLRKHYNLAASAEVYFDVHKDDEDEPRWLAEQMESLSKAEFAVAREACESMAGALWRGLDGVLLEIERSRN
ncbi:MAG TPA: iron-containing redox enzyme family protein [Chloroflexia bacterium]